MSSICLLVNSNFIIIYFLIYSCKNWQGKEKPTFNLEGFVFFCASERKRTRERGRERNHASETKEKNKTIELFLLAQFCILLGSGHISTSILFCPNQFFFIIVLIKIHSIVRVKPILIEKTISHFSFNDSVAPKIYYTLYIFVGEKWEHNFYRALNRASPARHL